MKIKIEHMETHSNPSDDEIRSYMNFDKIVEEAKKQTGTRRARKWWITLPLGLALVSVWMVVINLRPDDKRQEEYVAREDSTVHDRPTDDASVQGEHSGTPIAPGDKTRANSSQSDADRSPGDEKTNPDKSVPGGTAPAQAVSDSVREIARGRQQPARMKDSPTATTRATPESPAGTAKDVYVQAEPRQGYTHLYAYFNENLEYPAGAVTDSIEGIETVSFTIDRNGRPVDLSIKHSLGSLFDQEALRLISNMPDWNPARLNGSPVASQLSVPLTFELKRIKRP